MLTLRIARGIKRPGNARCLSLGMPQSKATSAAHKDLPATPVGSYNEWDPLEEAVVGKVDGDLVAPGCGHINANLWDRTRRFNFGGRLPVQELVKAASGEVEELCTILQHEGVAVRRPQAAPITNGHDSSATMPRNNLLTIGDNIIETPMHPSSQFRGDSPFNLLKDDYLRRGATWTMAPAHLGTHEPGDEVTNNLGIEWLRSYLGDEYRIHVLTFKMAEPRPLAEALSIIGPGLVLFNPDRPCNEEEMFLKAGWRVVTKPRQLESGSQPLWMMSTDVSTNILMLDTKRAIVCRHEPTSNKMFEYYGIQCIPVTFRHATLLGGGLHGWTRDVRRGGTLESYV